MYTLISKPDRRFNIRDDFNDFADDKAAILQSFSGILNAHALKLASSLVDLQIGENRLADRFDLLVFECTSTAIRD